MICAIAVDWVEPPQRQSRRRNRGRQGVVVHRGLFFVAVVRRIYPRCNRAKATRPAPAPGGPTATMVARTVLVRDILRAVRAVGNTGIEHQDLYQHFAERYKKLAVTTAIRDLVTDGRLHSVRVTPTNQSGWPPMRLFTPEYSPLNA